MVQNAPTMYLSPFLKIELKKSTLTEDLLS